MEPNVAQSAHQQSPTLVQIDQPKRYKPSRFNAQSQGDDGTLILYNSLTGHRCGIPATGAPKAKVYLSQFGVQAPLDKLGEYLLRKGYIVESETDEDARWDLRYGLQQFRNDIFQLMLLASEECNFRCVYCSQAFKRDTMQPEVREGVRKLISQRIEKLRALHIQWFGGEPLLGYEAIEELAPYCQAIAQKHGVLFGSDITTNGYLLTPDRSERMVGWGITSYQITIDGRAQDHDQHRILKDGGGGTFRQIFNNITAMKAFDSDFTVAVRVNFDHHNVPALDELFSELQHRLGADSRFQMRFHPVGKWGGPNDDQLDVCTDREALTRVFELSKQARAAGLNSEDVGENLDPNPGSVCYAARPYHYVIGADGKVMKCTVVLDQLPDNIVGKLSEDGNLHLNEDNFGKWVRPYYRSDSMCQKCFYVPVCQGAVCPLPRITQNQRPCPPIKTQIKESLKHVWQTRNTSSTLVQIGKS